VLVLGGQHGFWAGKTHVGESIAQRSQRPQRGGIEFGENIHASDGMACWREMTRKRGKHRTEVTEGGIEFGENIYSTDSMACWRETTHKRGSEGKHRTSRY
jgi:hypothetical protein